MIIIARVKFLLIWCFFLSSMNIFKINRTCVCAGFYLFSPNDKKKELVNCGFTYT